MLANTVGGSSVSAAVCMPVHSPKSTAAAAATAIAVPNAAAPTATIPTGPTSIATQDNEVAAVDAVTQLGLDVHGDTPMLEYDKTPPHGTPEL
ncbi:hypothetical protein DFH09DRAFT_1331257 [Mycena vulgaris]|nr:hypothetical protein DFH09DRAFT_1331257 [Mycena vulgaris]